MTSFAEIGVQAEIIRGLTELGFTAPTPVQEKVIPALLQDSGDWISLAQTGTGKTAAFGIPLIQATTVVRRQTQSLVLCPTRELCVQVARDLKDFAKYVPGITVLAVYGGASIETQVITLRRGVHIIVATPGRLCDLLRRGAADISAISAVVLDEADEMLNMGFQEEINTILALTPATKKTFLFSATMSQEVAAIAGRYMKNPQEIIIGRRNSGAENIRHLYYMVRAKDRYQALRRIVDVNPNIYGLIFCRTRQETQEVADKLIHDGYRAEPLHGDLSQLQRDSVMDKFRRRNIQMLVATDVAARGVDVSELTHVINYNLPDELSNYTHRSGRTGRAGKAGISIVIIHQREKGKIREMEKRIHVKFEQQQVPSGTEVCEKQLLQLIDTMMGVDVDSARIAPFLPVISEKLAALDREQLIERFVAMAFGRFLEDYRNAPDLNVLEAAEARDARFERGSGRNERGRFERGKSERERPFTPRTQGTEKFTRFFVNIGKSDGVEPNGLIGAINKGTRNRNIAIGKIELLRNFSFIEADSKFAETILHSCRNLMVNGKQVKIEIAEEGDKGNYYEESSGASPWKKTEKRPTAPAAGLRKKKIYKK